MCVFPADSGEMVLALMSWTGFVFRYLLNLGICLFGVLVSFHYE